MLHHQGYPHYLDPAHDVPSLFYQLFTEDEQLHSAYLIHLPKSGQYLALINDLLATQLPIRDYDQWLTDIALMIHRLEYCLTPADAERLLPQALILLLSYAQQLGHPYEHIRPSDTGVDLLKAHDRFRQLPFQEVLVQGLIDQLFDFGAYCFDLAPKDLSLATLDQFVQSLQAQPNITPVIVG
ncbi:hypothetical protein HZY86_01955 [Aerococcaceae bacterium DSM 111020]|nr:hypothetical protein [Aerococcaceae bacterium DSM 111020]